ncbi:sugar transferase [Tsukamurella serpentis]
MSTDMWTGARVEPAHATIDVPLDAVDLDAYPDLAVSPDPGFAARAGSGPRLALTDLPPLSLAPPDRTVSRERATSHRERLTRWLIATDAAIAVATATAGILVALRNGANPVPLIPLVFAVHLLWLHRLTRSRPLAAPLMHPGSAELRRACGTVRDVFGPVLVIEVFLPGLLPTELAVICAPVALTAIVVSRVCLRYRLRVAGASVAAAPTLVVGGYAAAVATVRDLLRAEYAGARPVAVCLPAPDAAVVDAIEVDGIRLPVVGTDRTVAESAREADAGLVVLSATDSLGPDDVRELMWALAGQEIELVVTAGATDIAPSRVAYRNLARTPMLSLAAPRPDRSFGVGKRTLDLAVAGLGVALAAPVMAAIAIAIKLDSRGPVFYRAARVGLGGESFQMIKFRSMYVDADARRDHLAGANMGAGPLFKVKDDPRVTRVGRFIRRYSLDELPQFFNVIRGEMAVVGPRPALAHEVQQHPPVMRRRMLVKPGVTGAWQVSGRSDLTWEESIRLDVGYVENWSLAADIGIIARTVRTVLTSDGAY